jgi:hypothetical protein
MATHVSTGAQMSGFSSGREATVAANTKQPSARFSLLSSRRRQQMSLFPLFTTLAVAALLAPAPPGASAQDKPAVVKRAQDKPGAARKLGPPEAFTANAQVAGATGAMAAVITMKVDRYSPEADRDAVAAALKQGGYPAFLEALRKAPAVGTLTMAGKTVDIRWARQTPMANGRTITLVTDKPVYFVGGGDVDAKSRAGFDVAVLQFKMDDAGIGFDGTMAAAASVKAGGPTGVEIADYAAQPIALQTVTRAIK